MFNEVTREDIESTLRKIVDCIQRGNNHFILLSHRKENKDTLLELGFRASDVREVVMELTYKDYYKGPSQNDSTHTEARFLNSEIWEFGKVVIGNVEMEVYIKFSFIEDEGNPCTCCVSFHKPNFPIDYPFKED